MNDKQDKTDKTDKEIRKERKLAAKTLKRARIEESGGVRPRKQQSQPNPSTSRDKSKQRSRNGVNASHQRRRFGRVMETVPTTQKPRYSTVSIALPTSVVQNCQTHELRTQLVGQIARACAIYHVDEVVIFDDLLGSPGDRSIVVSTDENGDGNSKQSKSAKSASFMARVLQYMECPQYLRRNFFPMHHDLKFAGLLCPLDAPHHVRAGERSRFREGVTLHEDKSPFASENSFVNIGVRQPVEIDRKLPQGIRCTVEVKVSDYDRPKRMKGVVVSPAAPREADGSYWGYSTRIAKSIGAVFEECPFDGGYDLKIGTSERGDVSVDDPDFKFPTPAFKHLLVVFGGVAGIEECVDADESLDLSGDDSRSLFNMWVNTCPFQGSRTIRTEEAVLLSLARLRPYIARNKETKGKPKRKVVETVEFSDEASDESSSDGSCSEESE